MADKRWEIKSTTCQNAAVACCSNDDVLVKLQQQISELPLKVNELNKRHFFVHQWFVPALRTTLLIGAIVEV